MYLQEGLTPFLEQALTCLNAEHAIACASLGSAGAACCFHEMAALGQELSQTEFSRALKQVLL